MPRGVPLTARILEVAEEFLLLGIDRNDRLAAALKTRTRALRGSNCAWRSG